MKLFYAGMNELQINKVCKEAYDEIALEYNRRREGLIRMFNNGIPPTMENRGRGKTDIQTAFYKVTTLQELDEVKSELIAKIRKDYQEAKAKLAERGKTTLDDLGIINLSKIPEANDPYYLPYVCNLEYCDSLSIKYKEIVKKGESVVICEVTL